MTLQTLPFFPQPHYSVESKPRRQVNQFGDGYQQRLTVGLNPLVRRYNLNFNLKRQQAVKLADFFATHAGVKAFYFRECLEGEQVKVVCPQWTQKIGRSHTLFECEFEEVI
ncbi:phage-related protein [Nicoletella semolina]|uniref:Phage-related protein n=1 Tax=Nicoletella semolina TaxID=271160 RepID=A0A4R2N9N6_9PAST|nr:phage tail protein [Nicoletella semolina]MDH2923797.1 phage tail protein [Nicoletella semolina]TCP17635.1 phage-related protein [Nicoletella semolina]